MSNGVDDDHARVADEAKRRASEEARAMAEADRVAAAALTGEAKEEGLRQLGVIYTLDRRRSEHGAVPGIFGEVFEAAAAARVAQEVVAAGQLVVIIVGLLLPVVAVFAYLAIALYILQSVGALRRYTARGA